MPFLKQFVTAVCAVALLISCATPAHAQTTTRELTVG